VRTKGAGQSALLLLDVVEVLNREKTDYLVIGAFALSIHGEMRASSDVDALLHATHARLTKLSTIFKAAGLTTSLHPSGDDDPILGMLVLSDIYGNRVELLGGLRGLDPKAFTRGIEVSFLNEDIRFVGREDFIAMKCFAGGPQDMADARSAYLNAQEPVDVDLLRRITRAFGRDAADNLQRVLAR
jgi:hypothetical protein